MKYIITTDNEEQDGLIPLMIGQIFSYKMNQEVKEEDLDSVRKIFTDSTMSLLAGPLFV